jgi:undecaprenyl-phosphate galactose phosphotransferase/putative colanic acid biosynthesis UDP-glucose lipid carrier transferase
MSMSVSAMVGYSGVAEAPASSLEASLGVGMMTGAMFVLLARLQGLYKLRAILEPATHNPSVIRACAVSLLFPLCILFLLKLGADYSRGAMLIYSVTATLALPLGRLAAGAAARWAIRRGFLMGRPAVLIGDAQEMEVLSPADLLLFGIEEVARFAVNEGGGGVDCGELVRTQVGKAMGAARHLRATEFAILMPWSRDALMADLLAMLRLSPLPTRLYPDRRVRAVFGQHKAFGLDQHFSVTVQREPLTRWERSMKRAIDVAVAAFSLLALSPFLLLIAAAIRIDSPGPALFRQRRRGFDNREFVILKFRTMTVMEDSHLIVQAARDDSRVTRVGRILRRSSIDELPQLINVLRGEMSIVGPRPHAVVHDDVYGARIANYALRQHVKPGLTGAAQVVGLRGETREVERMAQRVERDIWYINNWSLTLDLKIMVLTARALLENDAF